MRRALRSLCQPLTEARLPSSSLPFDDAHLACPAHLHLRLARQASAAARPDLKQVLEEEPLGAWRHDSWWRLPAEVGAVGAYKIFKRRLEAYGPQHLQMHTGEFHLLPMLKRIQSPAHATLGLEAVAMLRRYRAHQQQHTPFSQYIGQCLILKALQVGAYDVVLEAFRRNHALGLGRLSAHRYSTTIARLGHAKQLQTLLGVYETMPRNGTRPTRDIMYQVTKACKEAGQLDLAQAYVREFEANGIQMRPGIAAMLEMEGGSKPSDAAAHL